MKAIAVAVLLGAATLCGCSDSGTPVPASASQVADGSCPKPGTFAYGALDNIRLSSTRQEQFGTRASALSLAQRATVESAWCNFQLAVAGNEPNCPEAPLVKDGGSKLYECGPYQIERIDRLAGRNGRSGFEVGAAVSFGPHAELEQVEFVETPNSGLPKPAP